MQERHGVATRICTLRGHGIIGARPKIAEALEVRYLCAHTDALLLYRLQEQFTSLSGKARHGKAWARRSRERYGQLSKWG
jgi:hypothetical protein